MLHREEQGRQAQPIAARPGPRRRAVMLSKCIGCVLVFLLLPLIWNGSEQRASSPQTGVTALMPYLLAAAETGAYLRALASEAAMVAPKSGKRPQNI